MQRLTISSIFGLNVRDARLTAHMSQGELARQSGLQQQYVSQIERGQQNVRIDTAVRLANALGLELWTMLTRDDPEPAWDPDERGQFRN